MSKSRVLEIWGNCRDRSEIVKCLSSRTLSLTLRTKSSFTKDGRPLRASSCTFVLPSLNIWTHFLTMPSLIALSPYTWQIDVFCPLSGDFHCTHSSGIRHTILDSWCWTGNFSETCRILYQTEISEISASRWFYCKNLYVRLFGVTAQQSAIFEINTISNYIVTNVFTRHRDRQAGTVN